MLWTQVMLVQQVIAVVLLTIIRANAKRSRDIILKALLKKKKQRRRKCVQIFVYYFWNDYCYSCLLARLFAALLLIMSFHNSFSWMTPINAINTEPWLQEMRICFHTMRNWFLSFFFSFQVNVHFYDWLAKSTRRRRRFFFCNVTALNGTYLYINANKGLLDFILCTASQCFYHHRINNMCIILDIALIYTSNNRRSKWSKRDQSIPNKHRY